jgi:uncharacterized protein YndB with AHSA1/START domain
MNGYGVVKDTGIIRFKRVLPVSLQESWACLTESGKRGKWLASGEMELREGGRVELFFRHADLSPNLEPTPERFKGMEEGHANYGRVTRCEPPTLLSFLWNEDSGGVTEVIFELAERGTDTILTLTHRGLEDPEMLVSVAGGWHTHLDILDNVLTGTTPPPFWSKFLAYEAEYRERLG